jgi:hypothetical protein
MNNFFDQTYYFLEEGRPNMESALRAAFSFANQRGIKRIVIFSAQGDGVIWAAENLLSECPGCEIIFVGFPQNYPFPQGKEPVITAEIKSKIAEKSIPLVQPAQMPFEKIMAGHPAISGVAKNIIRLSVNAFGGGMSLVIQGVLAACDAGTVAVGEHVLGVSADTAILARACKTDNFLTDFIVREILCKPIILTQTRKENLQDVIESPPQKAAIENNPPKDEPSKG